MLDVLFLTTFLIHQVMLNFNLSFLIVKISFLVTSSHWKLCLCLNYSLLCQARISPLPKLLTHVLPERPLWFTLQNSNWFFSLNIYILFDVILQRLLEWFSSTCFSHLKERGGLNLKTLFYFCLLLKPVSEYRKHYENVKWLCHLYFE